MKWESGQRLQNGRYIITKVLGAGGFGITYLANSQKYGQVVIKTLNETVQNFPDFDRFQDDFMNEALAISRCQHPHIVKVHRFFTERIPHPNPGNTRSEYLKLTCMVMEYVEGTDLDKIVEKKGRLTEAEALRYIRQAGQALSVVHSQELLHRDVKPDNIMVRQGTDEVVLIDFGIAREFIPNVTRLHTVALTPGYAPIEQYYENAKRGAFTDVYALAATLYRLVSGDFPPTSTLRAIRLLNNQRDLLEPPQHKNPQISDQVNAAIMKGMALRPEYRPQTMAKWLELLEVQAKSKPKVVVPPTAPPRPSPQPSPSLQPHPSQRPTPVAVPSPSPSSANSLSRRRWLKWVGLGVVGVIMALLRGLWQSKEESGKKTVSVDSEGNIIKFTPVRVDTYMENLDDAVQFTMVKIPAGTFKIGSPEKEDRYGDEGPQKTVNISSFFIGEVAVTQALYEHVMEENPSLFSEESNHPVENVSWTDAADFCKKLSILTRKAYRLPSEAEWEYACRANTTTPFNFGDTITPSLANYKGDVSYGNGPKGEASGGPTTVGRFPPNAFGLFDMHGNVNEWCQDYWHDTYDGLPDNGSAWTFGGERINRVLRGGSWIDPPKNCRSAFRGARNIEEESTRSIGFRIVCSIAG